MMACIVLYGKDATERPTNYTLRVDDLAHARRVLPQCLTNHRWHCGVGCEVTHWTISAKPSEGQIMRIVAAGEFDHDDRA